MSRPNFLVHDFLKQRSEVDLYTIEWLESLTGGL